MPYMYMPTSFITRPGSVGTPKLSENEPEHSQDRWSTGKFCSLEFPETKPWWCGRGLKWTISCFGGVEPGMWRRLGRDVTLSPFASPSSLPLPLPLQALAKQRLSYSSLNDIASYEYVMNLSMPSTRSKYSTSTPTLLFTLINTPSPHFQHILLILALFNYHFNLSICHWNLFRNFLGDRLHLPLPFTPLPLLLSPTKPTSEENA